MGEFSLYDRLNADLRLMQADNYVGMNPIGLTQSDCNRNYWCVVEHAHVPAPKMASMLEEVIRVAFDHGHDVRQYMEHFDNFCKDNDL
ncbi:MAG: hypothetical protein V1729_05955 [Candidatus Woesearchaeota archaeon]